MRKLRNCAADRFCRVHTAIKMSALLLAGVVLLVFLLERFN